MHSLIGAPLTAQRAEATVLTAASASPLSAALVADAGDYFYSASISLLDAMRGLSSGFYSWPTVKCYYSTFYALRAILAVDGTGVFYIGKKPLLVEALPGQRPSRTAGQTHEVVLNAFASRKPSHYLLSQNIGLRPPLSWLMDQRTRHNYSLPRFVEPEPPAHFQQASNYGVRRLVCEYLSDNGSAYTFDSDHAMLAYPLAALQFAATALAAHGFAELADEQQRFIMRESRDSSGKLTPFLGLLSTIYEAVR